MTRPCARCGKPYEARHPSRRFCSSACREAAHKARKAGLPESLTTVVEIPSHQPFSGQLTDAIARELEHAEQMDSALGQAALALAKRVDQAQDSGSSMAAMIREVRATLAEALKDAPRPANRLDELANRRAQKAAGQ